jgi:PAS domain S-box-containing protein
MKGLRAKPSWRRAIDAPVGDPLRPVFTMATEETSAIGENDPVTENRIQRVLDNLFAFVGLLDLNGTVVDINRASLQWVGVTRAEVIGRPIWECRWWSYDLRVQQRLRDAVREAAAGETVRYDVSVRMPDDRRRVIDFQLAPLRDERGEIANIIPSGVDVTDRKLTEDVLRERTEHLSFLAESASALLSSEDPLAFLDQLFKGLERLLNIDFYLHFTFPPRSTQLTLVGFDGLSEEQLRSLSRLEFARQVCGMVPTAKEPMIVDDVQSRTDMQTHFIRSVGLSRYVCYPLIAHGTLVGTLSFGGRSGVRFDDSSLALIQTVCNQVASAVERDHSAWTLRTSEERARRLATAAEFDHHRLQAELVAIAQGLVVFSVQGAVIEINPAFARMHGFESIAAARLSSQEFDRLFELRLPSGMEVPREEFPVARGLRGEEVSNYELEVRRRGRTEILFIGSYNVNPVRDARGEILEVVVTIHDITRRREMEEALRLADQRKDVFLATLAHELRNPLAPIRTAVEVMRLPNANEWQRDHARVVIDRQVRHMARLLDDLLDVSRITRGTVELRSERVSVKEAMETAVETAQPILDRKGHLLSLRYPDSSVTLAADPARLTQIFANLLVNAAKYTAPSGRIFFGAAIEGADIVIRVRDNGVGISPDLLPHVFEMFTQGPESTGSLAEGLGIGLSITKGLVELHGGRIEARSDGEGSGAEFIVRLRDVSDIPHSDAVINR